MGLEKLAWVVIAVVLFIGLLFLGTVQTFFVGTYNLISQFNDGFMTYMPGWFGWAITALTISAVIYMINSMRG